MAINTKDLDSYVSNSAEEIKNIRSSFSDHVKMAGKDNYRPRIVFFDFFGNKSFGIVSRPYADQTDYISCIAEMMYSYTALDSSSCVLVLDSYLTKNKQNIGNCLYCYFVADKKASVVCMPYSYNDNGDVVWNESEDTSDTIDLKDHEGMTQQMVELLYTFSHIDDAPFKMNELLSYYSSMNYHFRSFKELGISYIDYSQAR
jgi:hypothetical protein